MNMVMKDRLLRMDVPNGMHIGRSSRMGEIRMGSPARAVLHITVSDRRGEPAPGIPVAVLAPDNIGEGVTDDDGSFSLALPVDLNDAVVLAELPEGEMRQRVLLTPMGAQTVHFKSIKRVNGVLVTTTEGVVGVAGVGLLLTGYFVGGVLGNILAGLGGSASAAAVYSSVSRHV
jgi:hypothetical protein